jgi:hypothetical protein
MWTEWENAEKDAGLHKDGIAVAASVCAPGRLGGTCI